MAILVHSDRVGLMSIEHHHAQASDKAFADAAMVLLATATPLLAHQWYVRLPVIWCLCSCAGDAGATAGQRLVVSVSGTLPDKVFLFDV